MNGSQPRPIRTRSNLLERLDEQRRHLRVSCREFDLGDHGEAKRIATTLRVLFHATAQSHSLAAQLRLDQEMRWVDSTADTDNPELTSWLGLVSMSVDTTSYIGTFEPLMRARDEYHARTLSLNDWWIKTALRDGSGHNISRADLVKWFANGEGGAHVDPKLRHEYEEIKVREFGYEIHLGDARVVSTFGDAVPAALRQIAFEVESSFAHPNMGRPADLLHAWTITNGQADLSIAPFRQDPLFINRPLTIQSSRAILEPRKD